MECNLASLVPAATLCSRLLRRDQQREIKLGTLDLAVVEEEQTAALFAQSHVRLRSIRSLANDFRRCVAGGRPMHLVLHGLEKELRQHCACVEAGREFIEKHALEVRNLDV